MSKTGQLGIVMIVHDALGRVAQVARHWASAGCPLVIHVDAKVDQADYAGLVQALDEFPNILFCNRNSCDWGSWSLVRATQQGAEMMLDRFADVGHIYLASGSCLPLRPVADLVSYLAKRKDTDFIESASIQDVSWSMGGLDAERFTLRFPFSWKRQRRLFDGYVRLQRRLKFKRKTPKGLVPHLGSQWWCLSRKTLTAILTDPKRKTYDTYFKRVWIPDESYYQTLARLHSDKIESRSLTLSKFSHQGKPHTFYNDHQKLLRESCCFVARKIWPHANDLYQAFLAADQTPSSTAPNPAKIDSVFANAAQRRIYGRAGLYMQSRFPDEGWEIRPTAASYSLFQGFDDLLVDFMPWLEKTAKGKVHGHLFGPRRAEFAGQAERVTGGISDSAIRRDYDPKSFFSSLIWNNRDVCQCFQFGPDDNQDLNWFIAKDPNAHISVITGAWIVPLFHSNLKFAQIRSIAGRLQRLENAYLEVLRSPYSKARIRIMTMADFVQDPIILLQDITPLNAGDLPKTPKLVDLTGLGKFLQILRNQGMHPQLMGDFSSLEQIPLTPQNVSKPYLVRKQG